MKVKHTHPVVLTEEEKQFVKSLGKLRDINAQVTTNLTNFMRKYIDTNISICATCVAQIKFAIKSINMFVLKYKIDLEPSVEEDVTEEETVETTEDVTVETTEDTTVETTEDVTEKQTTTEEIDISEYHLGGAYWQFGEVKIKGKDNAIHYYIKNYK